MTLAPDIGSHGINLETLIVTDELWKLELQKANNVRQLASGRSSSNDSVSAPHLEYADRSWTGPDDDCNRESAFPRQSLIAAWSQSCLYSTASLALSDRSKCYSENGRDPATEFTPQNLWFEGPDMFGYEYPWGHYSQGDLTREARDLLLRPLEPRDRFGLIFNAYWGKIGVYPSFPTLEHPIRVVHPTDYQGQYYSLLDNPEYLPLPHPVVGSLPYTADNNALDPLHSHYESDEEIRSILQEKNRFCNAYSPYLQCHRGSIDSGTYGAIFKVTINPHLFHDAPGIQIRKKCDSFDIFDGKSDEQKKTFILISKMLMKFLPEILGGAGASELTRSTTLKGYVLEKSDIKTILSAIKLPPFHHDGIFNDVESRAERVLASEEWKVAIELMRKRIESDGSYPLIHPEALNGYRVAEQTISPGRRVNYNKYWYDELEDDAYCGWTSPSCTDKLIGDLLSPWGVGREPSELGIAIGGLSSDTLVIAAKALGFDMMIDDTFPGIPTWTSRGPRCHPQRSIELTGEPFDALVKMTFDESDRTRTPYTTRMTKEFADPVDMWENRRAIHRAPHRHARGLRKDGYILPVDQGASDGMWLFGHNSSAFEPNRQRDLNKRGLAPDVFDIVSTQIERLSASGDQYYRPLNDLSQYIIMEKIEGDLALDAMTASCFYFPSVNQSAVSVGNIHSTRSTSETRRKCEQIGHEIAPPPPQTKLDIVKHRNGFGFGRSAALPGVDPHQERLTSVYGSIASNIVGLEGDALRKEIIRSGDRLSTNLKMYYRDRGILMQMIVRKQFHVIDQDFRHCDLHWKNIFFSPSHIVPDKSSVAFKSLVQEYLNGTVLLFLNQPFVQSKTGTYYLAEADDIFENDHFDRKYTFPFLFPDQVDVDSVTNAIVDWYNLQDITQGFWLQEGTLGYFRVNDPVKHIKIIDAAFAVQYDPKLPGEEQTDVCAEQHSVRMLDIMEAYMTWDAAPLPKMIETPSPKRAKYQKWDKDNSSRQSPVNVHTTRIKRTGRGGLRLWEKKIRGTMTMSCPNKSDNKFYLMPNGHGIPYNYEDWRSPKRRITEYTDQELIDFFIYRYNNKTDMKQRYSPTYVEGDDGYWLRLFKNVFRRALPHGEVTTEIDQLLEEHFVDRIKKVTDWYKDLVNGYLMTDEDFLSIVEYYDFSVKAVDMPFATSPMHALMTTLLWERGVFGHYKWIEPENAGYAQAWMETVYSKLFAINPPTGYPSSGFVGDDPSSGLLKNMTNWSDESMPVEWLKEYKENVFDVAYEECYVEALHILDHPPTQAVEDRIFLRLLKHIRQHLDTFQDAHLSGAVSINQIPLTISLGPRFEYPDAEEWMIHPKRQALMNQMNIVAEEL
eukprot:GHVH01004299.1.p1 GENE.GHVH01004299.1~~GHVH01004299.1.p1  ORF type:complete len:1380 (+),score=190.55 GHVH01004299.1:91-4140(+)